MTEQGVEPQRSGMKFAPLTLEFQPSWQKVSVDNYEGMTQQAFQDSIAPFIKHGKSMPIKVPKGWRRVEATHPGKHIYVHMESGQMTSMPKEVFDTKREVWMSKDQVTLREEDLNMTAYERGVLLASQAAAGKLEVPAVEAQVVVRETAAPKAEKKKDTPKPMEEDVKAIEAAAPEAEADVAPPAPLESALPVGLLFPGQGSQYVKMLSGVKELPSVKALLEKSSEILGYDLLELCLKGPESKLEQTRYCQPAMYVAGMAAIEKLKADKPDRVERCQAVAGLSLGEYTALCVAGVFDFETGLKLVKLRGEAMQEAAELSKQSMLSVAGLDQATLQKLCEESKRSPDDTCQVANFLFPSGFSCAGSAPAIEALMAKATKTEGCLQAKLLKTSGGFHTKLMTPAQSRLREVLDEMKGTFKSPRCDVYMNVTGKRITPACKPEEICDLLAEQLTSCVQWEPSMRAMIKDGVTEFYECGPMKQLKAMMKRIDPNAFKTTNTCDV